jgi:SAM-dependent methyltransferase
MPKVERRNHPLFARALRRIMEQAEDRGNAEHRQELMDGLSGRVLEIGAGTGLNFPHYPDTVSEVMATEPEPYLREQAEAARANASVPVTVVDWPAERLEAEDGAFDVAIACLVLCSVTDPMRALGELARAVRPGGELRYYEHVLANQPGLARAQRAFDRIGVPRLAGGDHMGRPTDRFVRDAGWVVERERRFKFKPMALNPLVSPHVLGVAHRRPSSPVSAPKRSATLRVQ